VTHAQETCTRNLFQKLALMHVTKIVRFDWSAVFESFCYKKLALNRAAFYSVQVSGTSFLMVWHPYYGAAVSGTCVIDLTNNEGHESRRGDGLSLRKPPLGVESLPQSRWPVSIA